MHLWLDRLGRTGLTYGCHRCMADGTTTYTRTAGARPAGRRHFAALWSECFRDVGRALLRPAE